MIFFTREATINDISYITKIYNQGILSKIATLETKLRNNVDMEKWLIEREDRYKVIVVENDNGQVCGWASLNKFNGRSSYDGVADFSIYIDENMKGKGLGKLLLCALEETAIKQNFYKLVLHAFESNLGARALYTSRGFRYVGTYINQGIIDGKYINMAIMEKLI